MPAQPLLFMLGLRRVPRRAWELPRAAGVSEGVVSRSYMGDVSATLAQASTQAAAEATLRLSAAKTSVRE
eukprot:8327713-Alexandrium_andersonii.AAC.1